MTLEDRQPLLEKIQDLRGRSLVTLLDFDRTSEPPLAGLQRQFNQDCKESLFRVLKDNVNCSGSGVDILLYTRGG